MTYILLDGMPYVAAYEFQYTNVLTRTSGDTLPTPIEAYLLKISSQCATSWRLIFSSCLALGTREYTRDSRAADMVDHSQV